MEVQDQELCMLHVMSDFYSYSSRSYINDTWEVRPGIEASISAC